MHKSINKSLNKISTKFYRKKGIVFIDFKNYLIKTIINFFQYK